MCHIKCFSCHLPPVICHLLFAICQLATSASIQTQQKKTFKKLDGVGPADTWQVIHDIWHVVTHDMWHVTSRLLYRYGLRPMQWKLYGEGTTTYIQHMDMATARLTWLFIFIGQPDNKYGNHIYTEVTRLWIRRASLGLIWWLPNIGKNVHRRRLRSAMFSRSWLLHS